ncbi:hypothetical protein QMY50_02950 [Escherichia coli]|nr:hypothetical protein QMY50_02950 [Escherichia coli]
MRLFSIPPPTLLAGFLAVLIGYASSAAIIWQAAIVAGATTAQISGWMTALGLAMGVSTLTLTYGIAYLFSPHGQRLARLCWSPDCRD